MEANLVLYLTLNFPPKKLMQKQTSDIILQKGDEIYARGV